MLSKEELSKVRREAALKCGCGKWMKGRKLPKKTCLKMSFARSSEKHCNWKGEGASYVAKHMWVRAHFGKASMCQNPSCRYKNPKRFDWANISRMYKRERKDWIMLCPSCHIKYDRNRLTLKELFNSI